MAELFRALVLNFLRDQLTRNLYPWTNVRNPRVVNTTSVDVNENSLMVELTIAEELKPRRFLINVREVP